MSVLLALQFRAKLDGPHPASSPAPSLQPTPDGPAMASNDLRSALTKTPSSLPPPLLLRTVTRGTNFEGAMLPDTRLLPGTRTSPAELRRDPSTSHAAAVTCWTAGAAARETIAAMLRKLFASLTAGAAPWLAAVTAMTGPCSLDCSWHSYDRALLACKSIDCSWRALCVGLGLQLLLLLFDLRGDPLSFSSTSSSVAGMGCGLTGMDAACISL